MPLLTALAAGLAVALGVLTATGHGRDLRIRLPGPVRRRPARSDELAQAGLAITAAQERAILAGVGGVVGLVCWAVAGSLAVGLVPAVASATGVRGAINRRQLRRSKEIRRAWPDGIRHLLATVRSGQSIHAALLSLARSGPATLREAWTDYPALAATLGPELAMVTIRDRLADPVSDRMIELLMVAYGQGTELALDLLATQAGEVEADLALEAEIWASSTEQRVTATVAFVAPLVLLVGLVLAVEAYRDFYSSPGGYVVCVIGGGLGAAGLWIARRLSREQGEARVLT